MRVDLRLTTRPPTQKVHSSLRSTEFLAINCMSSVPHENLGLQDWQLCAMNYNCSAATVRKDMWLTGSDCNGDGFITCEDCILNHHYGRKGCLNHYDGGTKFNEHQPFLQAMFASTSITLTRKHSFVDCYYGSGGRGNYCKSNI